MNIQHETETHRVIFVQVPDDTDFTNLPIRLISEQCPKEYDWKLLGDAFNLSDPKKAKCVDKIVSRWQGCYMDYNYLPDLHKPMTTLSKSYASLIEHLGVSIMKQWVVLTSKK